MICRTYVGINNPLEAAVIFGVLYYLYGAETLYDFA